MRKVKVEYLYFYWFRKKLEIDVPEKWEELNEKQFEICSQIIYQETSDEDFIAGFFGLKKSLVSKLDKFLQFKLIEMAEFVSSPKAINNIFYLSQLPGNPFVAPGAKLRAPGEKLKGITFEHFMIFDTFFFDYINDPTEYLLHKFVASLYLKKGELITEVNLKERVDYISKNVDNATLYAIFLNYTFIRKWLSKSFRFLFDYSEGNEVKTQIEKLKKKNPNKPDWISILDAFVSDDILNYDKYKEIPCMLAFKSINKRIQSYKKDGK